MGEESKPADQTAGNRTACNGANGERDSSEEPSRNGAEGRMIHGKEEVETKIDKEAEQEARRRMRDKEINICMTETKKTMNPRAIRDGRSGTRSRVAKACTASASHGETWASLANAAEFPMRWRPGKVGKNVVMG